VFNGGPTRVADASAAERSMPFLHDPAQQESELLFVVSGLCLRERLTKAVFAQGKKGLGQHSAASRGNQGNVGVFHARVAMSPSSAG